VKDRGVLVNNILLGLSFASMMAALYLVFIWVPTEREMGVVQRIFYFHVPLAWVSFLAFFVVFVSSILYLWNGGRRWDSLAYSSAEIGVVFTTLVLITGPIWAKPVWGTWWVWDERLTTTLVLWLIYLAYLMVRSFASDESQGARFAAVVGVVGFVDVPFVVLAIVLRTEQHPGPLIFEGGLTSSMLLTLLVCVAAFTILYVNVLVQRMSLREVEAEIAELRQA
jgi:heme exporter protein C